MQRKWTAALLAMGFLAAVQASAEETQTLKGMKEKLSYSIGVQTARTFKTDEVDIDPDLLMKGLKDALSGGKLLMPETEVRQLMRSFQTELRRRKIMDQRVAVIENKQKGDEFLAANKTKEGVTVLPNRVQYIVLKKGDGKIPTNDDTIVCNFRGTLLNGTEFESSETGKPATLKVSSLITGWREAMKLMPVGSTWKIFIPPQLAYGERGVGSEIGPNETLMFEVELIGIK